MEVLMRRAAALMFLLFPGLAAIPRAQSTAPHAQTWAGQGKVLEGLRFPSPLLNRDVHYAIYLPADYDLSTRRYPVVYLLHGFTDDESAWIQFGEANLAADRAIAAREIPPMIIVMPDGDVTWYVNDYRGQVRYEDMFVQEFIPFIDRTYRTRAKKEFRGISGLSMGGYGSLMYAMRHPDLFVACAAFSSGVMTDEEIVSLQEYDRYFASLFDAKPEGQNRLNQHWRAYNPLDLARKVPLDRLKTVHWYLDCGDDDFLYKGNSALHVIMRDIGLPHEYRVRDGDHSWAYWRSGITAGLKFIGEDFNR
jgi:enterochelin esterase-like enzyme